MNESENILNNSSEDGEIAADYLEELLDIADIDGDIEIEKKEDRSYIYIYSNQENSNLESLIGKDGEVLFSLQELSRLAVFVKSRSTSRLILDIADYKYKHRKKIEQIVRDAIIKAQKENKPVALEPMSSYERKIAHSVVSESNMKSESQGFYKNRHVIISL